MYEIFKYSLNYCNGSFLQTENLNKGTLDIKLQIRHSRGSTIGRPLIIRFKT